MAETSAGEAGRIDNVLELVGELIIGKSMLQQALQRILQAASEDLLRGRFADAMAFQARGTGRPAALGDEDPHGAVGTSCSGASGAWYATWRGSAGAKWNSSSAVTTPISRRALSTSSRAADAPGAQRDQRRHRARKSEAAGSRARHDPTECRPSGQSSRGGSHDDGRGIDAARSHQGDRAGHRPRRKRRRGSTEKETLDSTSRAGFSTAEQVTKFPGAAWAWTWCRVCRDE